MSQSQHCSHESLSPEECDRLVLSPPPVAFNPTKLREFLSVNRTVSAKHSLYSVNTDDGTPPPPRHASVAWSRSEFDSKFKQYESELKSTAVSNALQEVHFKRISLDPSKDSEQPTSSPPPLSIHIEKSESAVPALQKVSRSSSVRQAGRVTTDGWRRFLCCVPSRAKLPMHSNRLPLQPILQHGSELVSTSDLVSEVATTKITRSSKWSSLFNKRKNVSRDASKKSTVRLSSVQRAPQLADERLKSPAPTFLVTRHEATNAAGSPADAESAHGEENGVAGYHVNPDDRMSESVHSEDSLHSDDSYLEPADQANPGENLLGDPSPDCIGKKCLVLDLDETLVHSSFKPVENADFTVTVEIDNVQHDVSVCKRPHLETFIETVGPLFEVVMFTASLSKYADPVCDRIDPSGHFKHRLFRESCVCFKSNYIKHLAVLGRDIEQICIIDNSPVSFYFHRQNALQIVAWFDDPTDTALLDLIPYLKGLAEAPSVLEYVSQYAPPPSAAIAQPDLSPWVFGATGLCSGGWGSYNDDEEEDEDDVDAGVLHDAQRGCQNEGEDEERLPSPHSIITMAPRPAGEVVTAT